MSIFTDDEKTDIRRFMGYDPIGTDGGRIFWGVLYNEAGIVEYRMDNLTDAEMTRVRKYLTTLRELEDKVLGADENFDTSQVAVLKNDPFEVHKRIGLFNYQRRALCTFLGLPPGPNFKGGRSRGVVV